MREENQQLHRLLLLSANTRHCAAQDKEWNTLLVRGFFQQCSFRSIIVPVALCWGELVLCTKPRVASTYPVMCQYCWPSMLWGLISQYTFRPLMKVEERHGVSEHQKQLGTSLHCTRTCTSVNWFSIAGTCPRHKTTNAPLDRQWNQLIAPTCSVTRSQWSICRMTWYKQQQEPNSFAQPEL